MNFGTTDTSKLNFHEENDDHMNMLLLHNMIHK